MSADQRAVGIVLAAGASRRAGTIKALAELDGRPLVSIMCDTLLAGGCERVVVVVGPPHGAAIAHAVATHSVVENPEPELGMFHSLQLGVAAAGDAGAVVVALVDHPSVRPGTVAALLRAHEAGQGIVLQPEYAGRRGHPFLIDSAAFADIERAAPTAITRDVLAEVGDRVGVPVDDPGIVEDIDTREGLTAIGAHVAPRGD